MSLYRVHFTYKSKEVTLSARLLDMTHPYFVSIKDIILPKASSLIIDPTREEFEKTFGHSTHLMIPFQSVALIEELDEDEAKKDSHISQFSIIDTNETKKR